MTRAAEHGESSIETVVILSSNDSRSFPFLPVWSSLINAIALYLGHVLVHSRVVHTPGWDRPIMLWSFESEGQPWSSHSQPEEA